jgi:hypothetical protein
MSIGWISGRNTLLATLFGLLALRLAIASCRSRAWRSRIMSWLCFALALASGEFGVSSLAYVAAFALFVGERDPRTPDARRLQLPAAAITPQLGLLSGFAVVLIAWITFYKLGGYGSEHSGFYVDASRDPGVYLLQLLSSIPIYLASVLTFPVASLSVISMPVTLVLLCAALAILFVSRRLWLPWIREDARARTLGAGSLLAILPLGSSPAQDRMVAFIALGVCGLVALIVEERLGAAQVQPQKGARRLLRYRTVWAPLLFLPMLFRANGPAAGGGGKVLDAVIGDDPRRVLLINAPSDLPAHFVASKRDWLREPKPPIDVLYAGGNDAMLTRKSEQTLELSVPSGYFQGRIEQIGRDPARSPFHVGEVISAARMRTQVLEVKDGAPTRVRFDFTEPLSQTHVLAWQGRNIVALKLPKVGESTQIKRASAI